MKKISWVLICCQMLVGMAFYTASVTVAHAVNQGVCDANDTAVSGATSWCTATPAELTVNLYKFGLCKTLPTYNNYTDCQFFVNSTNLVSVTMQPDTTLAVGGDGEIDVGTYPYLVQLWGAEIEYKVVLPTFSAAQYGADGNQGRFCYTNGNRKLSDSANVNRNISCTTSAELAYQNALPSKMLIVNLASGDRMTGSSSTGPWDAFLLDDVNTLEVIPSATATTNSQGGSGQEVLSSPAYLFSVMSLTNPVVITENTTSLNLSVKMTNAFKQEFYSASTHCYGSNTSCLGNVELMTLGFEFTAN